MEHATIDEHSWVERYHQGLLPPDDEARFEAHFIECPRCMEQLELARGFQRGLKTMVAEDTGRATAVGLFAWLAARRRFAQIGFALTGLLVALSLPYLWFRAENHQLRQAAGAGIAINTPVFILSAVRSDVDEPKVVINLATSGDRLILAVDVDEDLSIESYRATVSDAAGKSQWQSSDLVPNSLETLMVTFPSSFFAIGDYRLDLEGLRVDGTAVDFGGYGFRMVSGVTGDT